MATILFIPFAEMGHLNPTIKLARALTLRGHRVTYLGLLDFQEYVSAQGLDFIPIFKDSCPKGFMQKQAEKNKADLETSGMKALKAIRTASSDPFRELHELFQKLHPDLLITDVIFQDIALMAEQAGIAGVLMSTGLSEGFIPLDDTYRDSPVNFPVLIFCPREFDFADAISKNGRFHIEASIDLQRQEAAFPFHALDSAKPLLYCSLGSQCHQYEAAPRFFRQVIEALRQRPACEAIVTTGAHLQIEPGPLPLPGNVHLVPWAPQLAVLKRASLMITHGGLGSVKECIFFGIPMIVFPVHLDQPVNAARVLHHGLGLRGNIAQVTADEIGAMIDHIGSEPSFRQRVRQMGERFRQIERAAAGVQVIESILASLLNQRNRAR